MGATAQLTQDVWTQSRQDVQTLTGFLAMLILLSPGQFYIFQRFLCQGSQFESLGEDDPALRARRISALPTDSLILWDGWFLQPRLLHVLFLITTIWLRQRMPAHRRRVLGVFFVGSWACHTAVNLRMLYLGVRHPVLAPAMTAIELCLGLSCHTMLPFRLDRRRDDVCAFVAVAVTQGLGALLVVPPEEARIFVTVLGFGSIVPIAMCCLTHERRRLEREAEQAEARAGAFRMINHSSKRIMLNVIHVADTLISELDAIARALPPGAAGTSRAERGAAPEEAVDWPTMLSLLRTVRAEADGGYRVCESQLLLKSIVSGTHITSPSDFTAGGLYDELGLRSHARVETDAAGAAATTPISADRPVLLMILQEVVHNALRHGQLDAPVTVCTSLRTRPSVRDGSAQPRSPRQGSGSGVAPPAPPAASAELHIAVRNAPGAKHEQLLERFPVGTDLLQAGAFSPATMHREGLGSSASTFCGLLDLRLCAGVLGAHASLLLAADHVAFELACPVGVVPPAASPSSVIDNKGRGGAPSSSPDTSPTPTEEWPAAGEQPLIFVCADDDEIGRLMAQATTARMGADPTLSLVLGATHAEVAGLADAVCAMARHFGDARVLVTLDQYMVYEQGAILGAEVCAEMRARGFGGVVAIITANDDEEAAHTYRAAGADVVSGKTPEKLKRLPAELMRAHRARFMAGPATPQWSPHIRLKAE